jgi:hypothetical protein
MENNNNYKWDLSKKEQIRKDNKLLLEDLRLVLVGIICVFVIFIILEFLYLLSVFIKNIEPYKNQ